MIREFFGWARWVWSRQETWQKWWLFGMFLVGASINAEGVQHQYLLGVALAIFGFHLLKWAVWDAFRASWAKYKQERNNLLTTIKESDQKH